MIIANYGRLSKVKVILFIILLSFIFLYRFQMKTLNYVTSKYFITSDTVQSNDIRQSKQNPSEQANNHMKYILQWTSPNNVPFTFMGRGQQGFIDRKCPYINCFVTADKNILSDITKFDVVAFSASEVASMQKYKLPAKRSPHQKYVFASIESSAYYPVCSNKFDGYFNWTWTFRLDSEVRWGYMVIRDEHNNIIGPNKEMHWLKFEDMRPVSDEFREQLKSKTKAAAWFVSHCRSKSKREVFARKLRHELKKYDLSVDVYGSCGTLKCPQSKQSMCFNLIKKKYYFYLSFENSYSEDYVTEKLLNAVWNNAVPIVYGAANYTRFIPDGAYLNARDLGVKVLAATMNQLIKHPDEYAEYFRWKNHYSYHRKADSVYTDEYCLFCSILNDRELVKRTTIYQNFNEWWNPPKKCP